MAAGTGGAATPRRRADARRNERTLLDAAAAVFVDVGVDAPVRDIAARAGVGVGTIYRHFPTRADLIVAVYRHQVEACADHLDIRSRVLDPGGGVGGEVGVLAEDLVRRHELRELDEQAARAEAGVQWVEALRRLEPFSRDHALARW